MVSGLEESSRSLTGVRIGWSGLALLLSFTSAIAIAGNFGIFNAGLWLANQFSI